MNTSIKKLFTSFALLLALVVSPAWAGSLDDAKAKGLVGERSNGYLGVVSGGAPADVRSLVAQINDKRRAAYAQGAQKSGVERAVFELRMGQRLQQRAPAGHYIQLDNGKWTRK